MLLVILQKYSGLHDKAGLRHECFLANISKTSLFFHARLIKSRTKEKLVQIKALLSKVNSIEVLFIGRGIFPSLFEERQ